MVYVVAVSLAVAVGLTVILLAELLPAKPRALEHRLAEIQVLGMDPRMLLQRRHRQQRRERMLAMLQTLGSRLAQVESSTRHAEFLMHAGYRHPNALAVFWGLRIVLAFGMLSLTLLAGPALRLSAAVTVMLGVYFFLVGWVGPVVVLRSKRGKRQAEIVKALPDALDLLVICVEAGLGLNQALSRVADDIRHVSEVMSLELALVNLEISAGAVREDALRYLAERTGVEDVRTLVAILVQTDRFGTSVARSLRVHSDTLREKRRQRAEEAAAKTPIKMVFPLVLCILPAMFVVILVPGMIQFFRELAGLP